jgi:hypothetical protein
VTNWRETGAACVIKSTLNEPICASSYGNCELPEDTNGCAKMQRDGRSDVNWYPDVKGDRVKGKGSNQNILRVGDIRGGLENTNYVGS